MDKLKYSRCLEHEDASIVSIGTNQSDLNQKPEDIAIECGWPYGHQEFSGETNILQRVAPLGHGSLGIVEEVRVPNRTKTFVRKQVYIPHYNRRQRLKMVQAEGDFLKSLAHPHVVKVIGTFQEGVSTGKQSYSILMSPVGDCDLKHLLDILGEQELKKDTFREQRQWLSSWFKCLSSALAYIHGQGVRHQDIKPQNIIHRGPDVFFTDFSSASNFRLGCTTSTENPARTTHMYAAPEVIAHIDHYQKHGRGTDVFALGAVFCEMRTAAQGKSVGDFQLFCRGVDDPETVDSINVGIQLTISKQRTPSLDSVLLYGNKTDRIDRWFGQDAQYTEYIKPMLRVERRSRPTASSVARSFRDTSSWSNKPCVCESQLWSLESSTVCL
ncbi:kinase-like protein [Patellaria atrata CBS 101060]|uniref:Kinase-like protein n=1 Tax=Patellaria atrata CBS 101060 TaxID=1346257 RepID=A0A9P4S272_9PEZI|nr:kinase-like protein [Patellaria atrata CBS 101060]